MEDSRLYGFSDTDCALRTDDAAYVKYLMHSEKLAPGAARKQQVKITHQYCWRPGPAALPEHRHARGLSSGRCFLALLGRAAGKVNNCSMAIVKLVAPAAAAPDYTGGRFDSVEPEVRFKISFIDKITIKNDAGATPTLRKKMKRINALLP